MDLKFTYIYSESKHLQITMQLSIRIMLWCEPQSRVTFLCVVNFMCMFCICMYACSHLLIQIYVFRRGAFEESGAQVPAA